MTSFLSARTHQQSDTPASLVQPSVSPYLSGGRSRRGSGGETISKREKKPKRLIVINTNNVIINHCYHHHHHFWVPVFMTDSGLEDCP